jgi:hypothetical protein
MQKRKTIIYTRVSKNAPVRKTLKTSLLWIHCSMPIEREIGEGIIKRKTLAETSALNTNK